MKCTNCKYTESKVVDSRAVQSGSSIRRRRECLECNFRFTTYEYILPTPVMVIKKNGLREEYNRKKLTNSFHLACKKRPVPAEQIFKSIKLIEEKLSALSNVEVHSEEIGELVMYELKKLDKIAFVRFASVYREFQDIGQFQAHIDDLST
ncbi:MAG: transcriptional regulator NrdR [Candidatus Marinimicrobia bacterium]|nr:transcriptional regulator NrdR [Candidatus Neomarinimicrobiota bacterium]|tara:strand:+ start:398 stop:847 length:450 start_codon:yes stop_codon:yes gene_type:complete